MLFRVNTSLNKFYVFGLALLFTVALAGCGGGGGKQEGYGYGYGYASSHGSLPTAEQCVADGGRVEDDGLVHLGRDDRARNCGCGESCQDRGGCGRYESGRYESDGHYGEATQAVGDDAGLGGTAELGSPAILTEDDLYNDRHQTRIALRHDEIGLHDAANPDERYEPPNAQMGGAGHGLWETGRTMHVRAMEAWMMTATTVEEIVIVQTDIEAPVATAFAKVYPD